MCQLGNISVLVVEKPTNSGLSKSVCLAVQDLGGGCHHQLCGSMTLAAPLVVWSPHILAIWLQERQASANTKNHPLLNSHFLFIFYFYFIFCFLGLHLWHMKVPRLGVESELQLPASTTVTATWDMSHICDLHCSSHQCPILNPLSKAGDRTWILVGFISAEPQWELHSHVLRGSCSIN